MKRKLAANALAACFGIALALILLEAFIRAAGSSDADGSFTFMGHTLGTQALPLTQLRARIDEYIAHQDSTTIIYDAALGWAYRPLATRQGGAFSINRAGFRSGREFPLEPPADTLRIALFGDSFTAGDDVGDDEGWASQLERILNESGIRAEVLNFGVGGYGMDQAYLSWMHRGAQYDPDIVIFGLQPENLKRNVNVFRQLLDPSRYTLPFSKPRFVLQDGAMSLVNNPPLPPEALPQVFENFGGHPLARHEFHYRSRDMAAQWWSGSRLANLLYSALKSEDENPGVYVAESEGGMLGVAIVDAFAESVRQRDASFIVLHLPLQSHLRRYHSDLPPPKPLYHHLLSHSRANYHYIAMEESLDRAYLDDAWWTATKHYGPALHLEVAEAAAARVLDCINAGDCALPRFDDISAIMREA